MAENFLKIAQDTILETEGVSSLAFPGVLPKIYNKALDLDVYVNVVYGVNIPEISWNIQENIKQRFISLPNIKLGKINIHIEGISFKEKENYE